MNVAKFTKGGGKLSAEVVCNPRRDGSYELRLWHKDLNQRVMEWGGNFLNLDDDRYDSPSPPEVNDGRLVQALVVVAIPAGVSPSDVSLVIRQKDTVIGGDSQLVKPNTVDQLVQLWVELAEAEDM